jgi:hypothetical protein
LANYGLGSFLQSKLAATFTACPMTAVDASVDVVWGLLTNFAGWGSFYDVRVLCVEPPGPAVVGQRMRGESGPRWLHLGITFEFTRIEVHRKLEMDHPLPFRRSVSENGRLEQHPRPRASHRNQSGCG